MVGEESRQQEGYAEPQGVDGQQRDAAGNGGGGGADREDGAENGSDAGCPAEGKGEAQHVGRKRTAARDSGLKTELPQEQGRLQQAKPAQAEEDEERKKVMKGKSG